VRTCINLCGRMWGCVLRMSACVGSKCGAVHARNGLKVWSESVELMRAVPILRSRLNVHARVSVNMLFIAILRSR
jgi:hypothetical protein